MFEIQPTWKGRTAVIIAGGASLTCEQIRRVAIARLEDKCRVIAVNDAVYLAWWADWLHSYDFKWWNWHIQRVQYFKKVKTTVDTSVPDVWVTGKLSRTGKTGFDPMPWACRGSNSGYQAVHCALHAGAERIVLLGMDMQGTHWFGDHPDGRRDPADTMALEFNELVPVAKARGTEIINASPSSVIECFRRAALESVL